MSDSGSLPTDGGIPWQVTLAAEFSACAAVLTARMSSASLSDRELSALIGQRAAYQSAAADLRAAALDRLLAGAPEIARTLADATAAAQGKVAAMKGLAAAVGLATALLGLATAIGIAVATGDPAGLVSAINGVLTAVNGAG